MAAEALTQSFQYEFFLFCTIEKGFSFPERHLVFIAAGTSWWLGQELGSKISVVY